MGGYLIYKQRFASVQQGSGLVDADLGQGSAWVQEMVSDFPYEVERGSGVQKVLNFEDQVNIIGQVQSVSYREMVVRTSYKPFDILINSETKYSVADNSGEVPEYKLVESSEIGDSDLVVVRCTQTNDGLIALEVQKIIK